MPTFVIPLHIDVCSQLIFIEIRAWTISGSPYANKRYHVLPQPNLFPRLSQYTSEMKREIMKLRSQVKLKPNLV